MFDLFKKNAQNGPKDAKIIRDKMLQFIKDQLKKVEGGEGNNIKGINLFISCNAEEKYMYEAAVFFEETDRFKNEEVQKIADDYAIDLPQGWTMEMSFTESLPPEALQIPDLDAGVFIATRKRSIHKHSTAYILVRMGEAEKDIYTLTSTATKIYIGRGKKVQTDDGFYRENDIAFPEKSENKANPFVSRQHAHIEYDNDAGIFLLFADEGGVPPRNKIKVRSANTEIPVKLYTTRIGHPLQEGDQIVLGESALLEFSYSTGKKEV